MIQHLSSDPLAGLFIAAWLIIIASAIPLGIREYREWAKIEREFDRLKKK